MIDHEFYHIFNGRHWNSYGILLSIYLSLHLFSVVRNTKWHYTLKFTVQTSGERYKKIAVCFTLVLNKIVVCNVVYGLISISFITWGTIHAM